MFKQRKHLALLLAIVLLLSSVPALAVSPGGGLTLGNSPINSLNGGPMVRDGDTLIWTSPTGIYADGVRLTTEAGRHLNVMGRGLYFTVGTDSPALRRYDLTRGETETLFTWDAPIDQLFITGDNRALLLSGGQVHRVNLGDGNIAADVTAFSVTRFIPTAYGTIYATGDLGNYTLFAGDSLIEADVTIFFTEGDLLILRRGITDYAIPIQTLFTGGQIALSAYQPLAAPLAIEALTSTGECCPICLEGLWEDEFPITQLAAVPTQSLPLTQSQENVVLRARQMSEIRWTPLQNITGWRGNTSTARGIHIMACPTPSR
ncbi:MAG: hypothetical protein FWC72_01935 [Oscillospiraceae bacterium]|nr:hypothetical protein [Oscillospiraceae bacterium]